MEILKNNTSIDFLGKRKIALIGSSVLILISIVALLMKGLNFGIDFTGGTLVEVGYDDAVVIESIRGTLEEENFGDAVVQHFGTTKDVLVRLPAAYSEQVGNAAEISSQIMEILRKPYDEVLVESNTAAAQQQCASGGSISDCRVQMRRVEFVGPQSWGRTHQSRWSCDAVRVNRHSDLRYLSV